MQMWYVAIEGAGMHTDLVCHGGNGRKLLTGRAQVAVGAMCGMTGEDATYSITGCAGAGVTNSITGAGAVEESDGAEVTSSISDAGVVE